MKELQQLQPPQVAAYQGHHPKAMRRYPICLYLLLFSSCLGNLSCQEQSSHPPTRMATLDKPPKVNTDTTHILEAIINLPQLSPFYHNELAGRTPLVIVKNSIITKAYDLKKFSTKVVFLTPEQIARNKLKAYLVVKMLHLDTRSQQAQVLFEYPIEGILGKITLKKQHHNWIVVQSEVAEK